MQTNPTEAPDYVEHIPDAPLDCANTLSDDTLAAGGLVRVSAFMRTNSSANAARVKKSREKLAADTGVKQLNVVVPLLAHAAMKTIAKNLQAGGSLGDVLKAALALEAPTPKRVETPGAAPSPASLLPSTTPARLRHAELAAARLASLKGWRLLLAWLMGLR